MSEYLDSTVNQEVYPLVSIVILNYNGLAFLGSYLNECLSSVIRSDYPNLEVIFVDNGSTDGSVEFVEKNFKFMVKVIKCLCNLGWSEGFNTGIRASKGKYIILLSNDMTVHPNLLKSVVRFLESNPEVGLVGFKRLVQGTINLLDGIGSNLYLCGRVKPVGTNEVDRGQYDHEIDDLDFMGGAMALRRETLQQVGLFDPDFKIFSEDVDLCFRIRKKGYKTVYLHNAVIWHRAHSTLVGIDSKGQYLEYMSYKNRIRCNIIHFTFRRLFASFFIDFVWFLMAKSASKELLLEAYLWNFKHVSTAFKKRLQYGPSPPFNCKYPVLPFNFNDFKRRITSILRLR
ncbi:MAG: glycosyltransferase family 2 protein [Candidatus Jordarchaeaceae archaeon]